MFKVLFSKMISYSATKRYRRNFSKVHWGEASVETAVDAND